MIYRLDKFISEAMGISRADAKKYIQKHSIYIDGVKAKNGDTRFDNDKATILCDGNPLMAERFVYIMLNKPQGVVSASEDRNDVTVVDLVKDDFPRRELFPRGRLDKTSTGFVLLTDDGAFAHDILSPRHHVDKTYIITTDAPVTEEVCKGFKNGVVLADGEKMLPAEIVPLDDPFRAKVVLHQGVYHQIKRMLGVYNIGVNSLHRIKIGELEMPDCLAPGEYVKLNAEQIRQIKSHC